MKRFIALIFMALTLTACSKMGSKSNITSLLVAPKLSQAENDIVKVISTYLGENVVLKYSTTMGYSAPVQITDIDDDGDKEAIVIYYAPNKGTNIRIALLENVEDKWSILIDKEGLGSDIFYFKIVKMSNSNAKQVLVGYSTPNIGDKFLGVYFLDGKTRSDDYNERCENIAVGDLTSDGFDDIIMTTKTPDKRVRIQVLSLNKENALTVVGSHYLKTVDVEITQLKVAEYNGKEKALYIDYKDQYKKMYTEAGVFRDANMQRILPGASIQRLWEYSFNLNSTDIDRDGKIEIPTVIHDETQDELPTLKFVEWADYSGSEPVRKYWGICDTQTGLFTAIPDEWQGLVGVNTYQNGKGWYVTRIEDGAALVKIKQVQLGDMPEINDNEPLTVRIGTRRWQVEFNDDVSQLQRNYIINSMVTVD
ncbi:MAG: hypothetical protein RR846_01885 [Oscillospiraceae bacterium]